ncbi:MAG: hypothetical protein V4631_07430 [Pseudomonadota bacterium]
MTNETFPVGLPTSLYLDLSFALRKCSDSRQPEEIVVLAVKTWLATQASKPNARGYQWKTLFLPDETDLRMRYRGTWHYAKVEGDRLMFAGESVSPRDWTIKVSGTVRNAWRDIWIRRNVTEGWTRASMWREQYCKKLPGEDRRRMARRLADQT